MTTILSREPAALLDAEHALRFITEGHAFFTLRSIKTQRRFTYRVVPPRDNDKDNPGVLFVSAMVGPDNEKHYRWFGYMKQQNGTWRFTYSPKAKLTYDNLAVQAFAFVFNSLVSLNKEHPGLEIWHEGRCCRCGRLLTVPESIKSGVGPECSKLKLQKTSR